MKYIIELEKIEGTDLWKAKGCNTLVFDQNGINNILKPYEVEKRENVDWSKVEVNTLVEVYAPATGYWLKRYFAGYKNGKVYTFDNGRTSITQVGVSGWDIARLV